MKAHDPTTFQKAHAGDPWAALELIANVAANVPAYKLDDESFLRASVINCKALADACLKAREDRREIALPQSL